MTRAFAGCPTARPERKRCPTAVVLWLTLADDSTPFRSLFTLVDSDRTLPVSANIVNFRLRASSIPPPQRIVRHGEIREHLLGGNPTASPPSTGMLDLNRRWLSPLKPTKAIAAITSSRTAATMKQPRRFARSVGEFGLCGGPWRVSVKNVRTAVSSRADRSARRFHLRFKFVPGYGYRSRHIHQD